MFSTGIFQYAVLIYTVFIKYHAIYSYFNRESHTQQLSMPSTDPCHCVDIQLSNVMEIYQVIQMEYNEEKY